MIDALLAWQETRTAYDKSRDYNLEYEDHVLVTGKTIQILTAESQKAFDTEVAAHENFDKAEKNVKRAIKKCAEALGYDLKNTLRYSDEIYGTAHRINYYFEKASKALYNVEPCDSYISVKTNSYTDLDND